MYKLAFSAKITPKSLLKMIIKVSQIYNAVKGTRQEFEIEFKAEDFKDLPFAGKIKAKGHIMRVQEGVMMLIDELTANQVGECVLCGKTLTQGLSFMPAEWLFYEQKPLREDDENELLTMDRTRMEINAYEPIRQELILNMDTQMHCKKKCAEFKEPEKGIKALAGLKDLIK